MFVTFETSFNKDELEQTTQSLLVHFNKPIDDQESTQASWGLKYHEISVLKSQLFAIQDSKRLQQLGMDQMYDTIHFHTLEPISELTKKKGDVNLNHKTKVFHTS